LGKQYSGLRLRRLAIDKIYLGKSVKFLTVVRDLESGAIVFVGRGKGADALDPFWKRLRGSRARIEAVVTDMSPAFYENPRRVKRVNFLGLVNSHSSIRAYRR
jgi:hypothetical protein